MKENPFENALQQLARAARVKKFDDRLLARLARSEREVSVAIPLQMDDGSERISWIWKNCVSNFSQSEFALHLAYPKPNKKNPAPEAQDFGECVCSNRLTYPLELCVKRSVVSTHSRRGLYVLIVTRNQFCATVVK